VIGEILLLAGAVLTLVAGIGVVRFDDVLTRMHALTKATTLGALVALLGAAIGLDTHADITSVLLAAGLQLFTSPVGANLLGRASYRADPGGHGIGGVDELAARDAEAAQRHPAGGGPAATFDVRSGRGGTLRDGRPAGPADG
jgi:multicomponent Na+:H+ antiporter subunit G